MKELNEYITNIVNSANWNVTWKPSCFDSNMYEDKVNLFIKLKYENIKQKNYFVLKYNNEECFFYSSLDPEFEKELLKHYPEKLI